MSTYGKCLSLIFWLPGIMGVAMMISSYAGSDPYGWILFLIGTFITVGSAYTYHEFMKVVKYWEKRECTERR